MFFLYTQFEDHKCSRSGLGYSRVPLCTDNPQLGKAQPLTAFGGERDCPLKAVGRKVTHPRSTRQSVCGFAWLLLSESSSASPITTGISLPVVKNPLRKD